MGVLDWEMPARRQEPQGSNNPHRPQEVMEQCCRQSGWVLISREVDKYRVRSGDHQWNVYVDIRYSQDFSSVVFQGWFPVRFSLETPPSGLFGRVLLRSTNLRWGAWEMSIGGSCEACLCVCERLPASALTPALFREVCEDIAAEIRSFHQELQDKFAYNAGTAVANPSCPPVHQEVRSSVPMRRTDDEPGIRFLNSP